MSGHAKTKVEKDTSERWLLTYSDLMNLLLILFIILYSMANVDVAKYQQVAQSLRSVLGANSASGSVIGSSGGGASLLQMDANAPSPVMPAQLEEQQMESVKQTISDIIQKQGLQGDVEVTMQERGVVISIKEKVLFKSGSADIEQDSLQTIEKIGRVLTELKGKQIRIEGHTDSDPIKSSRFPDNQELSTARANSVWRIFVQNLGMDPKMISATGYGEYRPVVQNDTLEHKAQNRRVDIAVLRDAFDAAEAGVTKNTTEPAASGNASDSAVSNNN